MHGLILVTTLALLAALAAALTFAARTADMPPPPGPIHRRTHLVLGLTMIGILMALATLRDGPLSDPHDRAFTIQLSSPQPGPPPQIPEIPVGQTVNFHAPATDAPQGLAIYDADMLLLAHAKGAPGRSTKLSHTFQAPGRYHLHCIQRCGTAEYDILNEFKVIQVSAE